MKLDNKRTILAGLGFLSICTFWAMYDSITPLILSDTFHMDESVTGIIMAADNVLGLFLLPLFGSISDKWKGKMGRRMPFIIFGTVLSCVLMNILPVIDNSYYRDVAVYKTIVFIIVLGMLLVTMGIYRSPTAALMPDITPKPLRSKANAIINLMGAVGGATYLGIATVTYPTSRTNTMAHVNYQLLFAIVSAIMIASVIIMFFTLDEPKLVKANDELEEKHPEWNLEENDGSGNMVLPRPVKMSLVCLLMSIAFWYIGYNSITTWFSTYVSGIMGEGLGSATGCILVGLIGAIVSYIPIGIIASKIGRKKTIMAGVLLMATAFFAEYFLTTYYDHITFAVYVAFAFVGIGWGAINVNSLPMVVQMCRGSDIGKFTGYYYSASMVAQVVTPVLAGSLMKKISYEILFPYAAIFTFLSFVTMIFVRHGDSPTS